MANGKGGRESRNRILLFGAFIVIALALVALLAFRGAAPARRAEAAADKAEHANGTSGAEDETDAAGPTAAPDAPTAEPTPTVAPLSISFRVNGATEDVLLGAETREVRFDWQASAEVRAWRLVLYNSDNEIVADEACDGAQSGLTLTDLAPDSYRVTLSAVPVIAEAGDAEVSGAFELRGAHETVTAQIAVSRLFLAYLDDDGRVRLESRYDGGESPLEGGDAWRDWTDVVQIAVGSNHLVALTADGTVLAAGANGSGQIRCAGLTGVRWIAAGDECTACVLDNGMLRLFGTFSDGQNALSRLKDVDRLSISQTHVAVLLRDGTALAVPLNAQWQGAGEGMEAWSGATQVSAGYGYTLGVRADGTVLYAGPADGRMAGCAEWTGVAAVSAGNGYALGLKSDGTVISLGEPALRFVNVADWSDIAAVAAGFDQCAGLRADGTIERTTP